MTKHKLNFKKEANFTKHSMRWKSPRIVFVGEFPIGTIEKFKGKWSFFWGFGVKCADMRYLRENDIAFTIEEEIPQARTIEGLKDKLRSALKTKHLQRLYKLQRMAEATYEPQPDISEAERDMLTSFLGSATTRAEKSDQ